MDKSAVYAASFSPQPLWGASLLNDFVKSLGVSGPDVAPPTDNCKENCIGNNRLIKDVRHLAAHLKTSELPQEVESALSWQPQYWISSPVCCQGEHQGICTSTSTRVATDLSIVWAFLKSTTISFEYGAISCSFLLPYFYSYCMTSLFRVDTCMSLRQKQS